MSNEYTCTKTGDTYYHCGKGFHLVGTPCDCEIKEELEEQRKRRYNIRQTCFY